jgi:peptidyl-prolyl cis-trans isomerase C
MKKLCVSVVVCTLIFASMATVGIAAPAADTVVAKVNDIEIPQAEVDFVFATFVLPQIQQQLQGQAFPEDQKAMVEKNILEQLVVQKLILEQAFHLNITPDEEALAQQMESAKQYLPDADMEQLEQLLKADLTVQQVIEETVVTGLAVSDEEAQSYYDGRLEQFQEQEQVKASHIIVLVEPDADQATKDTARQKIDDILAKATAGEDFAELAKEFSEGPSKDMGGDLGFFGRGQMVPEFEEVAFAMNEGDISGIVETQFGYHIIKLTEKKSERQIPFEEVEAQIRQSLLDEKINSNVTEWIEELRANATIEMMNVEASSEENVAPEEDASSEEEDAPEDAPSTEEPAAATK